MNTGQIDIDKIPDEGGKKMNRYKNKHLKLIEMGDKTIMIDSKTID